MRKRAETTISHLISVGISKNDKGNWVGAFWLNVEGKETGDWYVGETEFPDMVGALQHALATLSQKGLNIMADEMLMNQAKGLPQA